EAPCHPAIARRQHGLCRRAVRHRLPRGRSGHDPGGGGRGAAGLRRDHPHPGGRLHDGGVRGRAGPVQDSGEFRRGREPYRRRGGQGCGRHRDEHARRGDGRHGRYRDDADPHGVPPRGRGGADAQGRAVDRLGADADARDSSDWPDRGHRRHGADRAGGRAALPLRLRDAGHLLQPFAQGGGPSGAAGGFAGRTDADRGRGRRRGAGRGGDSGPHWRGGDRGDEADRVPRQHRARRRVGRGGADRRVGRPPDRRGGARR
ncbi:MAG: D-3-phosphoglycerate dehydrogenase, partial [uncultured Rubellimicrobium sp.]